MILTNANVNGSLKTITLENGLIQKVEDFSDVKDGFDCKGKRVIPGLIDVHTHGCAGMDTMDANFEQMCRFYAAHGTTSFLPTTMTMGYEDLFRVCSAKTDFYGSQILGFHFEGPYISKNRKGAQNEAYIRLPIAEEFEKFDHVKMVTIAPELQGSESFIKKVSPNCIVSIGHTDCDYDTALQSISWGANCLTHTFNAMPPMLHRAPGPIGAGFQKHIYAQIICDGFHVAPTVFMAAYKMFGSDRLTLISDSIRPAGLPDGTYESGGLPVILKDGAARLTDGTIAGSGVMLWDCVKKAIEFGVPFQEAVRMATQTPAEMLGIKKGQIQKGFDADFLIIDEQLKIEKVIIAGEIMKF